jgi:ankyrin repeat protein
MFDHSSMVHFLLSLGADIHATEKYGCTPLMFACRQGNINVIKLLVSEGSRVNDQNNYGTTSLMFACENGRKVVVIYLLSMVDINIDLRTEAGETGNVIADL